MIISKTNHMICDGLSIYHMWSLLQDGTPEEVWENRIRIPEKKAYDSSYNKQIRQFKFRMLKDFLTASAEGSLLVDQNGFQDKRVRNMSMSKTYKLEDLKRKSK